MNPVSISCAGGAAIVLGTLLLLVLLAAALASHHENEPVAATRLFFAAIALPVPFLVVGVGAAKWGDFPAFVLIAIVAAFVIVAIFPFGREDNGSDDVPRGRIDERDIMFSRATLEPGTFRFDEYYEAKPANRVPDDLFRSKPGLLTKGSTTYHPFHFSAADASFHTIEQLRPFVDGDVATERVRSDPATMSEFVKRWGRKLGAVEVGITELRDYHMYSVVGRGVEYGKTVDLAHKFAVALTVEMDKRALDSAPLGPAVMESAQQYVTSGTIAVQLAEFIRRLGYPARAHIDGNYRVVCPLVARDAGLGEIGRMGLLMTPRLGPRVRLGVVTTDLPLVPDQRSRDCTVVDFCSHCMKCADVCPSGAISRTSRGRIDGVDRWQINSEACFTLWCQLGTDCARCVKVCPYSHPDNLMHNIVRFGVRHSSLIRRAAVKMDDVLYGRRPEPTKLLDWQDVTSMED